jgi:hypothetical protein
MHFWSLHKFLEFLLEKKNQKMEKTLEQRMGRFWPKASAYWLGPAALARPHVVRAQLWPAR